MEENNLDQLRIPIPINQVEFRVQSISESGWALLLAYKDARVDMDRLDAVLGIDGWERKHELIDGQLFCHVGVWSEKHSRWIWKSDVGTESTTEKEKGRASDAFKRACFNFGIGRELYDYPLILVQLNDNEYYTDTRGSKPVTRASYDFRLKDWTWHSERTDPDEHGKTYIEKLQAVDEKSNERFTYPRTNAPAASRQQSDAPSQDSQASSQAASQSSGEKPWYDDFDKDKESLQAMVEKGNKPQDLVKHLRKTYKVNKKAEAAIMALKPASEEGIGPGEKENFYDDDIPF